MLNLEDLELPEGALEALKRVMQVESPDVEAIREKRQRVQGAQRLDTITPNHGPNMWQIVLSVPPRLPRCEQVHNCYSGFDLHDAESDSYAQMNLYLGFQYLDARWIDSLESIRDFQKLVALGAVALNPPGLHVGVETLSPEAIEKASEVLVHYTTNLGEKPFFAALSVYAPYLEGKKKAFAVHMLNEHRKALAAQGEYADASAPAAEQGGVPPGLTVSIGARVLPE